MKLSLTGGTDEANTKASLDEEGWFHTGDVGELDAKGRFKIIDRVKVDFLSSCMITC